MIGVAIFRRAQLQHVMRHLRDDPTFPWRAAARATTNEAMALPNVKPNAATVLCYGRRAPFTTMDEVPAAIVAEVEVGVREALARGRVASDGASLGRAVGMTAELREELACWLIWPAGWRRADLAARAQARRDERRAKDRARKEAERRQKGALPRDEWRATSKAALRPWEIAGRSRRWFYSQPEDVRERLITEAKRKCTGASADKNSLNNMCAEQPVHSCKAPHQSGALPHIVSGIPIPDVITMSPADLFDDYCRREGVALHPLARERVIAHVVEISEWEGVSAFSDEAFAHCAEMWRNYPASPEEIERLEAAE